MDHDLYKYAFQPEVPMEEVEASLLLALMAVENLHGEASVRLGVTHYLDTDKRSCVIDARTQIGRDLNKLFTGLLGLEFGPDAFTVKHLADKSSSNKEATR